MQREISRFENEKISLNQRIMEMQQDLGNLNSQLTFEQNRFSELERVLEKERRSQHSNQKSIADLERANRDLQAEVDRQKLRVESKSLIPTCSETFRINCAISFALLRLGL